MLHVPTCLGVRSAMMRTSGVGRSTYCTCYASLVHAAHHRSRHCVDCDLHSGQQMQALPAAEKWYPASAE